MNLARIAPDGMVDPTWAPMIPFPVRALASARDGTDEIFVGGGATFLPYYATRLHRVYGSGNGEVDPFWAPEVNGRVDAIAVDLSGNIFIGGTFSSVDGEWRHGLAKLRANTVPMLDPTWAASAGPGISSLLLDDEGALYIGGNFSMANGVPRSKLARLGADGVGALDPNWDPGASHVVHALAKADNGGIFVAGRFTQIGGESISNLAKILIAGVVDTTWSPSINNAVLDISRGHAGMLYVGGTFTEIDGSAALRVARLDEDTGELDTGWNAATDLPVTAVVADPSGGAWIGGLFTRVNGESRLAAAFVNTSGSVGPETDVEQPGKVWAMRRQPNGAVILGGDFAKVDGEERRNLVRLDSHGQLDPVWNPAVDREVFALALSADTLYVGGEFRPVASGIAEGYLAKLSSSGVGAIDAEWNPTANGRVGNIELSPDGAVFIAGMFTEVDGLPRAGLAKIDGAGGGKVDPEWNPKQFGDVYALAIDQAGSIYVGGNANLLKFESSGSGAAVPSWEPSFGGVRDIEFGPSGFIFVGGDFGLAKLSTEDGALETDWSPIIDEFSTSRALAYSSSNDALYAAGIFDGVSAYPRYFLKMAAGGTGDIDPRWNPSGRNVAFLELDGFDGLYVGGAFDNLSWMRRNGIARLPMEAGDSGFANGFELY